MDASSYRTRGVTLRAHPDFLVIGAMKSATTTLHVQLARQPGLSMSPVKEPNFFSDDENYEKGFAWYEGLFLDAAQGSIRGESSTHYTKLPTYPRTVDRIADALPGVKLVYVMRHPVDRLVSQYVHERTVGRTADGLHEAIDGVPELIEYGLYSMQLRPYLETFGPRNVLPVFFARLVSHPQQELERICAFLGYGGRPCWDHTLKPLNVGSERLRRSALRDALVTAPVLTPLRQKLVPKPWTEPLKALWRANTERPKLSRNLERRLRDEFDPDLERLGSWLGIALNCANFHEKTETRAWEWADPRRTDWA
ncbi:MAG: sulfotransferase [Isosphaeraceae bacterium]|nr:sulfotransferase [Isosphaeraceae bacterium]